METGKGVNTDIIVARATASGAAALGVVRLSGVGSWSLVFGLLDKPIANPRSHRLYYRTVLEEGNVLDEAVVALFSEGKSFTGEESVEITVHGSEYILHRLQLLLIERGARLAEPGEFTQRAFLNGRLDLAQAEAVADIIAAEHSASHQVAVNQLKGGYSREILDLREALLHYVSLVELELDFGEEDVEFANREELRALVSDLLHRTQRLYDSFYYGNALKQGFQLVLAGRPNAGKSTLFNALLNEERAIVSDIAGTTRDSIEDRLVVDGISVRLVDTAGIREATDTIERLGIARTLDRVSKSGATLYVFDASAISPEDWLRDIMDLRSRTDQVWSVGNKLDLLDEPTCRQWEDYGLRNDLGAIHWISAVRGGESMDSTISLIKQLFMHRFGAIGDQTTVTNLRHAEALLQCNRDLEAVLQGMDKGLSGDLMAFHIRGAIQALGSITGIIDVEEILGSIFSRFCIGK